MRDDLLSCKDPRKFYRKLGVFDAKAQASGNGPSPAALEAHFRRIALPLESSLFCEQWRVFVENENYDECAWVN